MAEAGAANDALANNGDQSHNLILLNDHQEREAMFKNAYGEDKLEEVLQFDEELLKAEWEAYNHKVKLLEPVYKKRSEFIKKIPGFWLKAMTNDPSCNMTIDPVDRDALAHLEDLTLEHDPADARNVTFHFHFAKGNPYFSNRILSKKFTVVAKDPSEVVATNGELSHDSNTKMSEMNKKYDLERPVESTPVKIDWASDEHNLAAKRPWVEVESLEEDEAPEGYNGELGSFFNFFDCETDRFGIHSNLLELHSKVLDIYAGLVEDNDPEGVSEDEDSEESEDDPNQVVDLESEGADEPKKKKVKTSA